MGQCCGKPGAPAQQHNDITRNLAQRQQAWQSTGTVALRDAKLQELPSLLASFPEPQRIRRLDCSNNAIAALPPWLGQFDMLQTLSVSYNALASLPDSITQLQNLKVLQVGNNRLTGLPAALGALTKLEQLDASNNGLRSLPASLGSLTNLRLLNVSHNRLAALPSAIGSCTALEELDASNNEIEELAPELRTLGRLQLLSADCNLIATVPGAVLKECTSLATLTLHNNPIKLEARTHSHSRVLHSPRAIMVALVVAPPGPSAKPP